MGKKLILVSVLMIILTQSAWAWVYPEHREITLIAIQKLDSAQRAVLDRLWALARKGYESRLDVSVADMSQGEHPKYIDYAAFPAIAGDHSTSAENMVYNILHTDWILNVADITAWLGKGLAESTTRSERAGKLRDSDLRLLRADPEYVSRAGSNNVHFMLSRPAVSTPARAYFDSCFHEGVEINLIGTYNWYHTSALLKARRLSSETLTPDQQAALTLSMLADEAFALHFLQDAFSSGHVAGVWGNAALRKGTHDYYDENGLDVTTWQGERMVLTGDAYMRAADADRAAKTVMMSLKQVLEETTSTQGPSLYVDQPGMFTADTFNIARAMTIPARTIDPVYRDLFDQIWITTPIPGLGTGLGEIPRFRSEIGPFIGIAPAGRVSLLSGGFAPSQQTVGMVPSLEVALHIGLGMDGVLNQSGDGLVFLDLGWRLDGASSIKLQSDPAYGLFGSILAAVPSRDAFYTRLRLPFYVIPGDLIILGPLLALVAPKAMNNVIATAGAGGLIPWQTGLISPIGRFQFILGREVGVCFYGSVDGADSYLIPYDIDGSTDLALVSMRTTHFEFPILEYRPVRTFSRRQSASLVLQISAGMDIPGKVTMLEPTDIGTIDLKTTWFVGFRLAFDWRYYYARKKQTSQIAH